MLHYYGTQQRFIGHEELYLPCPACEAHTDSDVYVTSKYFHVYWIPFWPMEKEANTECGECGLKRYNLPIEDKFIPGAKDLLRKFKHPWYTYIIPAVVSFVIAYIIVLSLR
jgi:hypothetical protein